jgi:DNA-binding CsgD family transcriptional regulator
MTDEAGCKSILGRQQTVCSNPAESHQLIECLITHSESGVAILDSHFRYVRINDALAEMNGLAAYAHLGKTVGDVLGAKAATEVRPRLEYVFAKGERVKFHLTAHLPARKEESHWKVAYFPMMDRHGIVNRVCAFVTEFNKRLQLETKLFGFSRKLLLLNALMKRNADAILGANNRVQPTTSIKTLLNLCISEIVAISKLPDSPLHEITPNILSDYDDTFYKEEPVSAIGNGDASIDSLSTRERQVLQYLATGKCNKEIAAVLELSVKTIETHRARIMLKLGAHSLSDLIHLAIRHGLVEI